MTEAPPPQTPPAAEALAWTPPVAIDADSLRRLVDAFYARVRRDPELGPVFNDAVAHWPEHLQTLTDFWCSTMLGTRSYHGRPVPAHFRHRHRITPDLFARWLSLWRQSVQAMFTPQDARLLIERAEIIARSLQFALYERIPTPPPARNGK